MGEMKTPAVRFVTKNYYIKISEEELTPLLVWMKTVFFIEYKSQTDANFWNKFAGALRAKLEFVGKEIKKEI